MDTHFAGARLLWLVVWLCVWCLAAGARHARRSDPLSSERTAREAGRTFQKTTAFVATALVPFAAKVSVVPCCSVRFGTAEREQAEPYKPEP